MYNFLLAVDLEENHLLGQHICLVQVKECKLDAAVSGDADMTVLLCLTLGENHTEDDSVA